MLSNILYVSSKNGTGIFGIKEKFHLILALIPLALIFTSHEMYGLAVSLLISPVLMFTEKKWAYEILLLILGTGLVIVLEEAGKIILSEMTGREIVSAVVSLTVLTLLIIFVMFRLAAARRELTDNSGTTISLSVYSFLVTFILLFFMRINAHSIQLLIVDRFYPYLGNLEVFLLSLYAAWMTDNLLNEKQSAKWRKRLWLFFSIVFFIQFLLGISGFEKFMQTGKLHLPIPALVIGGPLYRGGGIFMAILLSVTLLFAGPSWCSHLCYIGALDQYFANRRKHAKQIPLKWRQRLRFSILIATAAIALTLNYSDISPLIAGSVAVIFAAVSIMVMMFYSSKSGVLLHCTSVCPVGWLTTTFGKINPFRIKLNQNCTDCQVCSLSCNYSALNREDISKREPNIACTLCGDCIGACPHDAIEYRFAGLNPVPARRLFISVIVTLHTLFIAVARV
jgi:polyferredoxin